MTQPRISSGSSWQWDTHIVASAFDHQGHGAFACGDGTLRLFGEKTEPEAQETHSGAVLSLIAHPSGGFLSGGDDGRLVHTVLGRAPVELFAQKGKWIENIAANQASGLIAFTVGKDVVLLNGAQQSRYTHASTATGVAFDQKGRRLAVSHYNGTSLWWTKSESQTATPLEWKGSHLGVIWSPDGKFVITIMQEPGLHGWRIEDSHDMRMTGYPAKVKSFVWERRGKVLLTGGAPRVVGWPFTGRNGPMGKSPLEVGPDRDAIVEVVAAHPEMDVVVGGTNDGTIWMDFIGDEGSNFLAMDLPKITCMNFSPEGEYIAVGTESGYAAVLQAV